VQSGDGKLIVRLKEEGWEEPIRPENISDGTLQLLGYLVALQDPASVLLLEEPENQVHPRLHYSLAEEAGRSTSGQVLVATHSPRFVDAMQPEEVWMFSRGEDGYAKVDRGADLPILVSMVESGGSLGDLWTEGYFPVSREVLVGEPSAVSALKVLIPRIVPGVPFEIVDFNGKADLPRKLPHRLSSYSHYWSEANLRIVVVVDRDDDNCVVLKAKLEKMAVAAGLPTLSVDATRPAVVFRIAIEELEAWFLGDVPALRGAYPKVPEGLDKQAKFRDPESVPGGTWEALWHELRKHGYFPKHLPKSVVAAEVAPHMNIELNRAQSFRVFRDGLRRLVNEGKNA